MGCGASAAAASAKVKKKVQARKAQNLRPRFVQVELPAMTWMLRDLERFAGTYLIDATNEDGLWVREGNRLALVKGYYIIGTDKEVEEEKRGWISTTERVGFRLPGDVTLKWRVYHKDRDCWQVNKDIRVTRLLTVVDRGRLTEEIEGITFKVKSQAKLLIPTESVTKLMAKEAGGGEPTDAASDVRMPREAVRLVLSSPLPQMRASLERLFAAGDVTAMGGLRADETRELMIAWADIAEQDHPAAIARIIIVCIESCVQEMPKRAYAVCNTPSSQRAFRAQLEEALKGAGESAMRKVRQDPENTARFLWQRMDTNRDHRVDKTEFTRGFFPAFHEVSGMKDVMDVACIRCLKEWNDAEEEKRALEAEEAATSAGAFGRSVKRSSSQRADLVQQANRAAARYRASLKVSQPAPA